MRPHGVVVPARRTAVLAAAAVVWLGSVCVGLGALMQYEGAPGVAAVAPAEWPARSRLPRVDGKATLVMFLHPHCPCSRASLEELDRLLADTASVVVPHVVVLQPAGAPVDWTKTDLWDQAAAIPTVDVTADVDGFESSTFRVSTSGQVVVYDADGRLRFSGGITASRGHAGDNDGRATIAALLTGASDRRLPRATPVYGCSLVDPRHADQVVE